MKACRQSILESPCSIGQETPAKKIVVFNHLATRTSVKSFWATQHLLFYLSEIPMKGSYLNASSS